MLFQRQIQLALFSSLLGMPRLIGRLCRLPLHRQLKRTVLDLIPLAFYMLLSPIVLIPCLFVGASGLPFLRLLLLSWACSAVGGILSFPLIHFFVVSSPGETAGPHVLLNAILASVIAGTIATIGMYSLSRGRHSVPPSGPEGNSDA